MCCQSNHALAAACVDMTLEHGHSARSHATCPGVSTLYSKLPGRTGCCTAFAVRSSRRVAAIPARWALQSVPVASIPLCCRRCLCGIYLYLIPSPRAQARQLHRSPWPAPGRCTTTSAAPHPARRAWRCRPGSPATPGCSSPWARRCAQSQCRRLCSLLRLYTGSPRHHASFD